MLARLFWLCVCCCGSSRGDLESRDNGGVNEAFAVALLTMGSVENKHRGGRAGGR